MRLSIFNNAPAHACMHERSRVWRACISSRRASGPHTRAVARRGRNSHLQVQAIGFDFGDSDGSSRGGELLKWRRRDGRATSAECRPRGGPSRQRRRANPASSPEFPLTRPPPLAAPPTKRGSKINSLGALAASLLVYGHVMKGAVGEAYLAALAVTQKYQVRVRAVGGERTTKILTCVDSWCAVR